MIIHVVVALLSTKEQNLQMLSDAEEYTVRFCVIFGTIITLIRAFILDGIREFRRKMREDEPDDKA